MNALAGGFNLRHDGRRLGIEGLLSGSALGLVLLVLVQEAAAAQAVGPRLVGRPSNGVEDEPLAGGRFAGPLRGRAAARPAEAPTLLLAAPWVHPDLSPAQRRRGGFGAATAPGQSLLGQAELGPMRWPAGLVVVGSAGGSPMVGLPEPDRLAVEPPPALLVVLDTSDVLVASTVDGLAQLRHRGVQIGVDSARIDLRTSTLPQALVLSTHNLSALARTLLGQASLQVDQRHAGLLNSTLLLGLGKGNTVISVAEQLDLALLGGMGGVVGVGAVGGAGAVAGAGRGIIAVDLAALQGSRVVDPSGDDSLLIEALTSLRLPAGASPTDWQLSLWNRALVGSTLELQAGHHRIQIRSAISLDPAAALAEPWPETWQFRAVGLENSQLRTGSGNDVVQLRTAGPLLPDPSRSEGVSPVGLERLALLASQLQLGDGDDSLVVEGDVVDSVLDLGAGRNTALFQDPLRRSTLLLSPGSSTEVQLSDQPDDLHLALVEPGSATALALAPDLELELDLDAGGGADRLFMPKGPFAGTLELWGAGGRDLFLFADHGDPDPAGMIVLADLDWQEGANPALADPGAALKLSDGLGWWRETTGPNGSRIESWSELTPSGIEGLGDAHLLPIAPLEQLLAGMATNPVAQPGGQLAIGAGTSGSELLWLNPAAGTATALASLPALQWGGPLAA